MLFLAHKNVVGVLNEQLGPIGFLPGHPIASAFTRAGGTTPLSLESALCLDSLEARPGTAPQLHSRPSSEGSLVLRSCCGGWRHATAMALMQKTWHAAQRW